MRYLWVVEQILGEEFAELKDEWMPTYQCNFTRELGRKALNSQKRTWPETKFRLTKYTPEDK